MAFHEVRFPDKIALGVNGSIKRADDIVIMGSGFEEINQRWADSQREFDVGFGIKSLDQLAEVSDFFEQRRGRVHAFRFKDYTDYKSGLLADVVGYTDVAIATGDGSTKSFQIYKRYGAIGGINIYARIIKKPVIGTVVVGIDNVLINGNNYTVDHITGIINFLVAPIIGKVITCGFEFDVPCRFKDDTIKYSLEGVNNGQYPNIAIIEKKV